MNKFILRLGVLFVLVFLLAACGAEEKAPLPVEALSVELSEFKFQPANLSVYAGKEISLTLFNQGSVRHDFVILKRGVAAHTPFDLEAQKDAVLFSASVEPQVGGNFGFTLPEAGTYEVICSVQGHLEAGMKARLTAVAP
jgi:uncharacterized cupredoxin-like copper-binding protein